MYGTISEAGDPHHRYTVQWETFKGANFAVLWLFVKVFFMKFGAWHSLARHKRAVRESFLCENRLFHQSTKVFSLKSFPLYSTRTQTIVGGLFLADNNKFMAALF